MTQISRPFQIGLLAVALFAVVWFLVLRGHSSSGTGAGSSAPAAATSAPTSQSSAGGGTPASTATTYHGSAPGVAGLTRAIDKARGAVAQSQQSAKQLSQKSALPSKAAHAQGESSTHSSAPATSSSVATHSKSASHASTTAAKATPKTAAPSVPVHGSETAPQAKSGLPPMQLAIESELKQGKVAAVLFWNPKGSVDATVRHELQAAAHKLHGKLAVHVALSSQVGSFGDFTHTVQVYSTPTILLINKAGKTASLTGLTDAFSINQAVGEVKSAK
jgi:hypothetical protein